MRANLMRKLKEKYLRQDWRWAWDTWQLRRGRRVGSGPECPAPVMKKWRRAAAWQGNAAVVAADEGDEQWPMSSHNGGWLDLSKFRRPAEGRKRRTGSNRRRRGWPNPIPIPGNNATLTCAILGPFGQMPAVKNQGQAPVIILFHSIRSYHIKMSKLLCKSHLIGKYMKLEIGFLWII